MRAKEKMKQVIEEEGERKYAVHYRFSVSVNVTMPIMCSNNPLSLQIDSVVSG